MPGQGQGKRSSEEFHDNVSTTEQAALLATVQTTAREPTAAARADLATDVSSSNTTDTAPLQQNYYMQDELEGLIAEARLEGWEGVEEGYK